MLLVNIKVDAHTRTCTCTYKPGENVPSNYISQENLH